VVSVPVVLRPGVLSLVLSVPVAVGGREGERGRGRPISVCPVISSA